MSEADIPLNFLCAICHVNAQKYTCPRCGIHTCSLLCVKLHKTRAQCSGVRNPADYRKRSELATEASFDKDFNFIASVERNVQRSNDDVAEKKIDLRPARTLNFNTLSGLEKAACDRGVNLIRAPVGLSRRKENKSRVTGKEGIVSWTVEWVDRNGKKRVQNHEETKTVAEAFFVCHPKRGVVGKKRKREHEAREFPKNEAVVETNQAHQTVNGFHPEGARRLSRQDDQLNRPLKGSIDDPEAGQGKETQIQAEIDSERLSAPANTPNIPANVHFYLYRPQTSSKIKCLIPISATDTIRSVLRGKKVVEFPTIYIRDQAPDELTEPFILESTYLEQHGEDVMVPGPPPAPSEAVPPFDVPVTGSIVPEQVLEVLKQDLIAI